MNPFVIGKIIGSALCVESALMLLPLIAAVHYGESVMPFVIPMAASLVIGRLLIRKRASEYRMVSKEGFVSTGLTWIAMSLVGMLPFLISGCMTNVVDAFFETVSGFTTTGSTVLTNVETVPKSVLIWRSFTQWIGGMGILVFMSAIMHFSGGSQMSLIKTESPGPVVSKLLPRASDTAKVLYLIYAALTVVTLVFLLVLRMPFFDALCITFGTAGTGGFSVLNSGCADYTFSQQMVITIAMIAFGMNFSFYFCLLMKKPDRAFRMEEIRLYLVIIVIAVVIVSIDLIIQGRYSSALMAVHNAAFHVGSMVTTTAFELDDVNLWPRLSQMVLLSLTFCGACAGSTACGFKISRLMVLGKSAIRDLDLRLHPDMVRKVHIDGKSVEESVIRDTGTYTFLYVMVIIVSTLLLSIEGRGFDSTFSAAIATFNNIGPGIGMNGTNTSYVSFNWFSKLVMCANMLIGRLEIFPILGLFRKETWRRF